MLSNGSAFVTSKRTSSIASEIGHKKEVLEAKVEMA